MIRLASVFFFTAFVTLSAIAQNCNLPAGTLGLGNYCSHRTDVVLALASTSPELQPRAAVRSEETPSTTQVAPVVLPNTSQQPTEAVTLTPPTTPLTAPTSPALSWNVTSADHTLSVALTRWANNAGWQLAWQAQRDLPAFRVSYRGSFEEAVESLMRDSQNSDYPLHACLYDNKVVRVLHVTQTCAR